MLFRSQARKPKGFTLVEVLCVVMILSICLVAIIKGFFSCIKAVEASEQYSRAITAADRVIFRMQMASRTGAVTDLQTALREDQFDIHADTTVFPQENGPMPLHRVELSVGWNDLGRSKRIMLSTCLLLPKDLKEAADDLPQKTF